MIFTSTSKAPVKTTSSDTVTILATMAMLPHDKVTKNELNWRIQQIKSRWYGDIKRDDLISGGISVLVKAAYTNQRMHNQQGAFILCSNTVTDRKQYIASVKEWKDSLIYSDYFKMNDLFF